MQKKYIHDLLVKQNMITSKPVSTLMASSPKLSIRSGNRLNDIDAPHYRTIVGSLQYLAFTYPDNASAVNRLSQFMHQPTDEHLQAAKRVLRYLVGTPKHDIFSYPRTLSPYMASRMQIGSATLMTSFSQMHMLCTLAVTLYLGLSKSKKV